MDDYMNRYTFDENRVLRQFWDAAARVYTEYNATGTPTLTRPFTPEENARADADTAAATESANEATLTSRARDAITANLNAITTLQNFAAGTATLTNTQRDNALRDLANQQVRAFKQLNALIRLEVRDLATTEGT